MNSETNRARLRTTQRGVDVIAENVKSKHMRYIEVKGGKSSRAGSRRFGSPYNCAQVFDRIAKGLFFRDRFNDKWLKS